MRFADQRLRSMNFEDLKTEIENLLSPRTAAEWVGLLHAAGLMATLAYSWKQVVTSPLFAENELTMTVGEGELRLIRTPARCSSFTNAEVGAPPELGEHNVEFLTNVET
ncbi:CoA transferase [Nocardia sp. NPDC059246]|uniref:CoA transferase n=1 Tax=unclassified Nocardia TaxID=2637762 RepID=UPI0036A3C279